MATGHYFPKTSALRKSLATDSPCVLFNAYDKMILFANSNDHEKSKEILRNIKLESHWDEDLYGGLPEAAYSAVYGYEIYSCNCHLHFIFTKKWIDEIKNKDDAFPKCYVCYQIFFRYILEDIIAGKEYSEVGGIYTFTGMMRNVYTTPSANYELYQNQNPNIPFRECIKSRYEPSLFLEPEATLTNPFALIIVRFHPCRDLMEGNNRILIKICF